MAHVSPLSVDNAPEASQSILKATEDKFGKLLNIFATLAYQPEVLEGVTKINNGIGQDLPEKLREMAYLKSSLTNDCDYCSHYHRMAAKKAGVSDQQIEAMQDYQSSQEFDDQEKAVLSYAEQLTRTGNVDPQTVKVLKSFLDDTQLVTLAATVGLANFTNRFNHGLGVELP